MNQTADRQAKIVIVGGGGAGLAAAISAVENGADDVLVIEQKAAPGGNALFPDGIFAVESPVQQRLNLKVGRDEMFRASMDYAQWKTNPTLVRTLINASGENIRWLEEKGVEFVKVDAQHEGALPTFHMTQLPGKTGAAIVRALHKGCLAKGVKFLLKTRVKKLLMDEKGRFSGLTAESDNREIKIKAGAVIIATGGFSGNAELLRKYIPDYDESVMHFAGIPHMGDGILMGCEIGAATDGMAVLEMGAPNFFGSPMMRPHVLRPPNSIWVNRLGQRFADESIGKRFTESANAVWRQPGRISYTFYDERIKQGLFKEPMPGNLTPTGVTEAFAAQQQESKVKISASWDEMAAWMGVEPAALKAAIETYNGYCDRGYDAAFLKDKKFLAALRTPPFYGIRCNINFVTTHGGLKINERAEVIDKQDRPIPGVYAGGVDTGGQDAGSYNVILTGHSFGFTIATGRIAGKGAAGWVGGK